MTTDTQNSGDDRTMLRFEANWDSSRHDSLFLNRVTPTNEHVYVTLSTVIEIDGCTQPLVVRENLCMRIHARDQSRKKSGGFFGSLMGPTIKETERVSEVGIWEIIRFIWSTVGGI